MKPEQRSALVLPGGGMRNVWQSGFLLGAEFALPDHCDIFACSSGACVGAALLAGQLAATQEIWITDLCDPRTYGLRAVWRSGRFADVDYVVDDCCVSRLDLDRVRKAPSKLIVSTLRRDTGETVYHEVTEDNASHVIKASCALPNVARPRQLDGAWHIDGAVKDVVPILEVLRRGYKRILVIANRPVEEFGTRASWLTAWLTFPFHPRARRAYAEGLGKEALCLLREPDRSVSAKLDVIAPSAVLPAQRLCRSPAIMEETFWLAHRVGQEHRTSIAAFMNNSGARTT